jgi:hypothetical protein
MLAGLQKIDVAGIDLEAAKRVTRQALVAVDQGRIGYVMLRADRDGVPDARPVSGVRRASSIATSHSSR